jgi:hypothetical protein
MSSSKFLYSQKFPQQRQQRRTKKPRLFTSDILLQQNAVEPQNWGGFFKIHTTHPSLSVFISRNILTETPQHVGRQFAIVKYYTGRQTPCFQLFYRSSGANSNAPHVWFPCDGLVLNYAEGLVYAKLTHTLFSKHIKQDTKFLDTLARLNINGMNTRKKIVDGAFMRFGTPLFMFISYLLGGEFWRHNELRLFLGQYIDFDMSLYRYTYDLQRHNIIPIESTYEDVNRFTQFAVSINYIFEQYTFRFPQLFDYTYIYENKIPVGQDLKYYSQCSLYLFIVHNDYRYIPIETLYNWNLPKTSCQYIQGYLLHLSHLIEKGRIIIS